MEKVTYVTIRKSLAILVIYRYLERTLLVVLRIHWGRGWTNAEIRKNGFELHKIIRRMQFP